MMRKLLILLVLSIFYSVYAKSQIGYFDIVAPGPVDVCNGPVYLYVDFPEPGYTYDWVVWSKTCNGNFPVAEVYGQPGDILEVYHTGSYWCVTTDSLGNPLASNTIDVRVIPGGAGGVNYLPAPIINNSGNCVPSATLCVPSIFSLFSPNDIAWFKDNTLIPNITTANLGITLGIGWYKYSITSSCGMAFSDSVYIVIGQPPSPSISGITTFCQGQSGNLNAGPGYSNYLWSIGAITQVININTAGTYTVTVTDANGCTGTASATVTVNPLPAPTIFGNTTICQGTTTGLDAGAGYSAYNWSTGAISQTINASTAGPFTVTVTDANGCTGSDSVNVVINPLPVATASANGPVSFCQGDSVELEVYPGGFPNYEWYRDVIVLPDTQPSIFVTKGGNYYCLVTDSLGCTNTTNPIAVTVPCISVGPNQQRPIYIIGEDEFLVYPNPTKEIFHIKSLIDKTYRISVFDLYGKMISINTFTGLNNEIIISGLSDGMYILKLDDGNRSSYIRLVKSN